MTRQGEMGPGPFLYRNGAGSIFIRRKDIWRHPIYLCCNFDLLNSTARLRDGLAIFLHSFQVKLDGQSNFIFSFCNGLASCDAAWKVR